MSNQYISKFGKSIPGSEIRELFDKAETMGKILSFAIGEPDFDTPKQVVEKAVEKLRAGETHYAPNVGVPELRDAIARRYTKTTGRQYSRENVLITSGTTESVMLSMQALLDPGDEIIVPSPHFASYNGQFVVAGISPVFVPTKEENGFQIDLEDMERAVTPKTKTILINSPANPIGVVFSKETLMGIIDVARRHNLSIITDEIYEQIVYDEPYPSLFALSDLYERTVLVSSFSKSYAMTGWRIGYTVSDEEIAVAMRRIHENSVSSLNVALQLAAVEAMENSDSDVQRMLTEYKKRRDLMCRLINSIDGLSCLTPKGAFYIFMNIKQTKLTSNEFTYKLLEEQKTLVVPGTAFGAYGEGYVRLSFAASEEMLTEGMERIRTFMKNLMK